MDNDEDNNIGTTGTFTNEIDSPCAVNSLILDYYKKFGRKRDLEQFFSLSTAQGEVKDTSGLFWRKMKSENDSSDSGGGKSDSNAQELCRISIRCSMPEGSSSQSDDPKTKTESPHTQSPPIITDDAPVDISRQTDDESFKSDDNHSQKSFDPLLDLSAQKPLSPTSSITSQRKLEWDSLADVGYANETDRKTSASSLSTLERLALKQQYSNNDSNQDIGQPTYHSTPVEENETKSKMKKGVARKMTKIIKKDIDCVEVNLPHSKDTNPSQSINVNLTKHISFNVEKDGGISFDNIRKDVNVSPEKATISHDETSHLPIDKEIQTSLPKTKDKSCSSVEEIKPIDPNNQKIPIMISLNTLRKRLRMRKSRAVKRRTRTKKKMCVTNDIRPQEKSGEQLSEAESFEYMPGHIYNQNKMKINEGNEPEREHNNAVGNKSSLESSCGLTTDSSKGSKHSLTQDLEKCINVLKVTLQKRYDDSETKKKLIKEIVQRLLSSKYRDDDTSTEFLSGLSFNSKKLDLKRSNTTSTSDTSNTDESKEKGPRKSILRMEKFDSNIVASTSQSAPNLYIATDAEKKHTNLKKVSTSFTESDASSKGKTSSDNALPKTSSEQFYLKYLEALRREESYKRHLRDKEMFLKQKLGNSVTTFKAPNPQEANNNRLKDLMKDLTRNNYDDGSGDASKLEGGSTSDRNYDISIRGAKSQRSHSVFTLSSSHSDCPKKPNLKKKLLVDRELEASSSKNHYCCCPHHFADSKVTYADSSVQVNIKYQQINDDNEKLNLDPLAKCPRCENYKYSTRHDDCSCSDKPKLSPRDIGTGCPNCGKPLKNIVHDYNTNTPYEKYPRSPRTIAKMVPNKNFEKKYICVCNESQVPVCSTGDHPIYQRSKSPNRGIHFGHSSNVLSEASGKSSDSDGIQFVRAPVKTELATDSSKSDKSSKARKCSQSSQTDMQVRINEKSSSYKIVNSSSKNLCLEMRKKPVIIHEATRCIQTEISINPQIADPTLSAIVIVNNCAELIEEQQREVNLSITKTSDQRTFSDVYTSSESGKFLLKPGHSLFDPEVKYSDMNISESKDCVMEPPKKPPNDYAIPIDGTNMTLVVSLASNDIKGKIDQIDQGVGTEKSPIADQGTCIAAECAKSAQCQSSTTANSTRNTCCSSELSSKKSTRRPSLKKSSLSKTSPKSSPQRNTYPKELHVKDKKPLRRCNTDIDKLETQCGGSQTEPFNNIGLSLSENNKAKTSDHSCQVSVISYDKIMVRSSCEKEEHLERKEIGIQKDISKSEIFERKTTPEMVSKCVGSDIETVQTNNKAENEEIFGNKNCKKTCTNCGGDNESECKCEKVLESNVAKTTCVKCGNDEGCSCNNSINKNLKESGCEVCLHDDVRGRTCHGGETQVPGCRSTQLRECGCDDISDCKHRTSQGNSLGKTKCTVCAGENCNCNDKEIPQTDVSLNKPCVKCGCLDSCQCDSDSNGVKDPIMDIIKDITKRYCKNDMKKIKKKKCFTEIITVLNYLLETDESTDQEPRRVSTTPEFSDNCDKNSLITKSPTPDKRHTKTISQSYKGLFDKNANERFCQSSKTLPTPDNIAKKTMPGKSSRCCDNTKEPIRSSESKCPCKHGNSGQLTSKCTSKDCFESSDMPCSTELPSTSDSTACKILKKIKRECEKYHLRRTKCGRKCEISSSTSINCDQCKKTHYCGCRHKCKRSKTFDKVQKKCVAYNLILQTSESMLSENTIGDKCPPLKNVVVKVPKCKDKFRMEMCKETIHKADKDKGRYHYSPRGQRSKSCPKESEPSSTDDFIRRTHHYTVREYLEKNRPDFVEKCAKRQTCLKYVNEIRATERAASRDLLSMYLHREPDLTTLSSEQLRELAQQIGFDIRRKKTAPKFISEHEMKKHSKHIYKTLPEVVQKKEEKKKENIKKTNLLMANIFKKNLQKNTLRGAVNLSNYNPVIKI
ncbi:unnamed protein product [Arctia plantaginis]|uniref:ALMS motif domain-containing protein n=1 Tax=Arctia plantaginis TaxID=874455 RepID=A0A8S0YRW0_ARCPL|nr:unnamed protein product [Arctia plantaginis]